MAAAKRKSKRTASTAAEPDDASTLSLSLTLPDDLALDALTQLVPDLAPETPTTVLNLCGFWGGQRQVKAFIPRVATSKEILRGKVRARMRLGGVRSAHLGWIGEHPYDPRARHLEGHPRRPCAL